MYSWSGSDRCWSSTCKRAASTSFCVTTLGRREQLLVGRGALLLGAIELENRALAGRIGIVDEHVQQEAIELRLGQRVRSFLLDRVLRRHDHEQRRQRIGHGADGDLPLAHRLEQRRLHLGRRAIDLVGEHEVVEQRALAETRTCRPAADRSRCPSGRRAGGPA